MTSLWGRLAGSVVVSAVYVWRAFSLRRGSRGAYIRLYYIAIIGLIGIAYLIFVSTQYPVWMRVEQILQAVVLVGLLIAVAAPPCATGMPNSGPDPAVREGSGAAGGAAPDPSFP